MKKSKEDKRGGGTEGREQELEGRQIRGNRQWILPLTSSFFLSSVNDQALFDSHAERVGERDRQLRGVAARGAASLA